MRWAARTLAIVAVVIGGMALLGFLVASEPSKLVLFGVAPALILLYSATTAWQGDPQRAVLHPMVQAFVVVSGTFFGYKTGLTIASMHGNTVGMPHMVAAWILALVFLVAIVLSYRVLHHEALAARSRQE